MKIWRLFQQHMNVNAIYHCFCRACIPATIVYATSLFVLSASGFSVVEIIRDTAQTTGHSSFLGFVSTIGSWLWLAAAAFCFFRIFGFSQETEVEHRKLLTLLSGFSFFLAVDDFFLIHDRFITEGILIPLYILFLAYLLKQHGTHIAMICGAGFIIAGSALFFSVLIDATQEILPISYSFSQCLEEGFKFVGAGTWAYFCFTVSAYVKPTLLNRGLSRLVSTRWSKPSDFESDPL